MDLLFKAYLQYYTISPNKFLGFMIFNKQSLYKLSKSRNIMQSSYAWYKKKHAKLSEGLRTEFETELQELDQALLANDREKADAGARKLEVFCDTHFKKSIFDYVKELVIALVLALAIATIVRQVWFELYEIPTGSMRPTFKEQDHLTVSKLSFGINTPLQTSHLYFDPNLVQRTGVLIFSGDGIPYIDATTKYFYVLPYKKRYIKRAIGKPGDSVYFYGGKIYAVDKEGKPLEEFLTAPWMQKLEHVPFLNFEGMTTASQNEIFFQQMNQPKGKLLPSRTGPAIGEVFNGKEWVKDQPAAQNTPHRTIKTYSDILGIRNFAMARLLTKQQLKLNPNINAEAIEDGVLYLELHHNPSLTYPATQFTRDGRGFGVILPGYSTVIPLQQQHLDAILDSMYTARFVVKDGQARRYDLGNDQFSPTSPQFAGIPDGTYEFYYGKGYKIGFGGITSELPADHPLYKKTPENIQKLFNLGIGLDTGYVPSAKNLHLPQRYAYYRDGDLYLLGAPILKKDDPVLVSFQEQEQKRVDAGTSSRPYVAFKDYGPPVNDKGEYDVDFIRTFGVTVPDKHYLVLGDNHAMSSDSRVFGFVPEDNIQGAPSLIVWPPGDRIGPPAQKPYQIFTLPRMIMYAIILTIAAIWYALHRRKLKQPIFKKL